MPEQLAVAEGGAQLSQVERVVDTFVAPRKTFTDILRSANCWLPLVLIALLTIGWSFAIDKKIGFTAVAEQQISKNPKAEEAMAQLTPAERASRMKITATITKVSSYCSIIFYLIFMVIETLILWASFNFALGAGTKFSQVFAVTVFAGLPRAMMYLLSIILIFAGVGTENFDMRNPVGTNLGFYLSDAAHWLQTAGTFFDVLGLWSLALIVIGMAIVARKTIAQSATVVVGWWLLILIVVTGIAAV